MVYNFYDNYKAIEMPQTRCVS